MITLINATDIEAWADRLDSRSRLPQLIRRLIHGTINAVKKIGFPSGEGVQRPGWDGIVETDEFNSHVPQGISVWELSSRSDVTTNANTNYKKRTDAPNGVVPQSSTFVYVTPRRWSVKQKWLIEKNAEGVWKEVRAYDADDLEQWLEIAPSVHVWISILLNKHPENAEDVESYWSGWSSVTSPPILEKLILSGRENLEREISGWLENNQKIFSLKAETREEALAVFIAVLLSLPEEKKVLSVSRTLLVRDVVTWNFLSSFQKQLILIMAFDSQEAVAKAIKNHKVFIPLGRADQGQGQVELHPLKGEEVEKMLIAAQSPSEKNKNVKNIARLAVRSLTAFRRRLAVVPNIQQPEWSKPNEGRKLIPMLLTGALNEKNVNDRKILTDLSRTSYESVLEVLVRWANESDPPIRHMGNIWFVISREDSWALLNRYLTQADLEHFENFAFEVLSEKNPKYDMPEEERYMASMKGQLPKYSNELKAGIAETIALLGTNKNEGDLSTELTTDVFAKRIVKLVMDLANTDWKIWASLTHQLSILAEAAPDEFLNAVENGLSGSSPLLFNLFQGRSTGMFIESPHSGLLWALETLAWNKAYLSRAAYLLAALSRLDPGGKSGNRPISSLSNIFKVWHPQTNASSDEKFIALDYMEVREKQITWALLLSLLPVLHGVAFPTSKPRWSDWTSDDVEVPFPEQIKNYNEILNRLIRISSQEGGKWAHILNKLSDLPPDMRQTVIGELSKIDPNQIDEETKTIIWDTLRHVMSKSNSFPEAGWALSKEQIKLLENEYGRFEPKAWTKKYGWVFGKRPDIIQGETHDIYERDNIIKELRIEAAKTICREKGVRELVEFSKSIDDPRELGVALVGVEINSSDEDELFNLLRSGDEKLIELALGIEIGHLYKEGIDWVKNKLVTTAKDWEAEYKAKMLLFFKFNSETWDYIETLGQDIVSLYWKMIRPWSCDDVNDANRAARYFLKYGKGLKAIDVLSLKMIRGEKPDPLLVAEALEKVITLVAAGDRPDDMFTHHVTKLLDYLIETHVVEEKRIALLEWAYNPVMGRFIRPPLLMFKELERNPGFFIELVSAIYLPEGEVKQPSSSEKDEQIASNAYELLDTWRTIPGTGADGVVDGKVLSSWVLEAREKAAIEKHKKMTDYYIGQLLSASPMDNLGFWPQQAVCEVIESMGTEEVESGFKTGTINHRGPTMKSMDEGGQSELAISENYKKYSDLISGKWPRTAAVLRKLSEDYRLQARHEDQRRDLRDNLNQ